MASFSMWKETSVTLDLGLNTLNLDPSTNILKIINENMLGSILYLSTKSDVTQNKFEEKVEKGSSSSLVRTRPISTAYIFNPSGSPITVTMIEIETDDISFIFNASNQVQISGVLTSDGLKGTELNLDGSRNLGVNVVTTVVPNEGYQSMKVTATGDTTIKTGGAQVVGLRTLGTITAIIKDGANEKWKHTAPAYDQFTKPISIAGTLFVNLSGTGEAYIIYK